MSNHHPIFLVRSTSVAWHYFQDNEFRIERGAVIPVWEPDDVTLLDYPSGAHAGYVQLQIVPDLTQRRLQEEIAKLSTIPDGDGLFGELPTRYVLYHSTTLIGQVSDVLGAAPDTARAGGAASNVRDDFTIKPKEMDSWPDGWWRLEKA